MHAPDPCTQLSRPSPSIYPPDRSIPMSTCMSPTCACVLPAETMMRFLRAGGQIEWLSIMTVMHGLRAARQSMHHAQRAHNVTIPVAHDQQAATRPTARTCKYMSQDAVCVPFVSHTKRVCESPISENARAQALDA